MSKKRSRFLKLIISIVLMVVLVWKVHPKGVVQTISVVNGIYIGLGFLCAAYGLIVSVVKWNVILRLRNLRVRFSILLCSYLVSIFAANFLPSRYGGDAVRIYDVGKTMGNGVKAASSVFAERLSGLFVLLLMGLIGALLSYSQVQNPRIILASGLLLISGLVFLVTLEMNWWVPLVSRLGQLCKTDKIERLSKELRESFQTWRMRPAACFQIFMLSVAFYVGAILAVFCYGKALHLTTSLAVFVAFVPLVYVLEAIPISLNGLGVREGAIVYLFGKVGVEAADALSLAIVILTMRLLLSAIGGLVFVFRDKPGTTASAPGISKGK